MTHAPLAAPNDARRPDEHRAGTVASARLPEWLVHLISAVVRFMLERMLAARSRRAPLPWWWNYRADLPAGSVQQLAAAVRGEFGNAIAWTCLRRGIGPGHKDWPELSRAIVMFGGSLSAFRPGLPAYGLQWWENPNVVPGMIGEDHATPAADAMASLLARHAAANPPPPEPDFSLVAPLAAAAPRHDASPVPRRPVPAHATTGPPTGPPHVLDSFSFMPERTGPERGRSRRTDSCRGKIPQRNPAPRPSLRRTAGQHRPGTSVFSPMTTIAA